MSRPARGESPLAAALPFGDAPVRPGDGSLDVNGMVPQAPQLQRFIQRSHDIQRVVALCGGEMGNEARAHGG